MASVDLSTKTIEKLFLKVVEAQTRASSGVRK